VDPSVEQLVRKAVEGDREALAELLGTQGPLVRAELAGAVPRRWQSVLSVDDALQDAYTSAFLHIAQFQWRGNGSFCAWLTTLARNALQDAIRMLEADKRGGKRRRVTQVRETAAGSSVGTLLGVLSGTITSPSGRAARDEACAVLNAAMNALPVAYRQVVQLYDIEERTAENVAASINRSVGAMFMLRARALNRLREQMGRTSQFLPLSR